VGAAVVVFLIPKLLHDLFEWRMSYVVNGLDQLKLSRRLKEETMMAWTRNGHKNKFARRPKRNHNMKFSNYVFAAFSALAANVATAQEDCQNIGKAQHSDYHAAV
jgi:hypothetical protein